MSGQGARIGMGAGARVEIVTDARRQIRDASNSGSYMASHDPRLLFGLGSSTTAHTISVRWPGGKAQTFSNVAADRYYQVTEDDSALRPFTYPKAAAPQQNAGRL